MVCAALYVCVGGLTAQATSDVGSATVTPTVTAARVDSASNVQNGGDMELGIRRIAIFSSGVAFFERGGSVTGASVVPLPFNAGVIDDALKSLTINDPASSSPQVNYPSESTLARTLRSLSIDLANNPGLAEILGGQRGAEIEIYTPALISGRVMGVEYRMVNAGEKSYTEPYLSIFGANGIKTVALKDISGLSFKDSKINADINRALDLILASRATDTRTLTVSLNGEGERAYRLDLSQDKPLLQGWAIVDNDSDTDWENVELSLVTGRPVSFIQRLYAPYYLARPVQPLAIAGIAEAATYNSGWSVAPAPAAAPSAARMMKQSSALGVMMEESVEADYAAESVYSGGAAFSGGAVETAAAGKAGDQFEFTIKKPVSLARQQSAMLPLVEATLSAEKTLVFSGEKALQRGMINPSISAELTNTTGMKLPAGPITVYDDGVYAGDALINFFPENEKRLISYGDDLSVTGSITSSSSTVVQSVTISKGVMTITNRQIFKKTYTIKNAGGEVKRIIIEHPITRGAELSAGLQVDERTDNVYRFVQQLPSAGTGNSGDASGVLTFSVSEEMPVLSRVTLSSASAGSFVSYISNQEIPANVRAALQQAVDLKKKADDAKKVLSDNEKERSRLENEQNRIRQNLMAAGAQTPQGQEYLKKLSDLDSSIDQQNAAIRSAQAAAQAAQSAYDAYIAGLSL